MISGYMKIFFCLTILGLTLWYAKQMRREAAMQAVQWDVQHPPRSQWVSDRPAESLRRSRAEARYLRELVAELDR
jgi:hypothetical protein